MKNTAFLLLLSISFISYSQDAETYIQSVQDYQEKENKEFGTAETTILTAKDFKTFEGLKFFPIDETYRVTATFKRTPDEEPFFMPTTTARLPEYVKYGEAHFTIKGKKLKLNLYQNTTPYEDPEYKDYLFLPFTDETNGDGSYGGGRFLDAYIPEGDTIILDFNKAYNPYCAYNPRYSCPIPPEENDLAIRIEAGVKAFKKH
ncbi:DUF1684 domain-containing protein [Luteirhabdus pelagi]|jgi:uncharacterized protein (DUF1684 family)|uniref:DUF1684 domain-containing protein n=1 Tax=Luteirhabdus pelagi TaxID=2792783 RepID=UPI00193A42F6|nr:DUF1684 domain-containing protein [Luteirhabdus pelagi]